MSSPPETRAERAGRMLAEAAEIMLGAMRGLGERLSEAETPEAAQGLAMALARVNRGLRQTLLLDAKLEKDAQADARAVEALRAQAVEVDIQAKKHRLRYAASREIVEACETADEAKELLDELEDNLDVYVRGFDFTAGTMDKLVTALLADFGIEREVADETTDDPAAAPEAPAPETPSGPKLIQQPDYGWAPAADSS